MKSQFQFLVCSFLLAVSSWAREEVVARTQGPIAEGTEWETPYGKARVVGISPHPEQADGLRMIVPRLIEWCMGANAEGSK